MLAYNEIKIRKYIVFEGEPYEVLASHVFRKQQRKPVNQTKLKSLINGRIVEHSFHVSDKAEEAEIDSKPAKYLYASKGQVWFCDPKNPSDRFFLEESIVKDELPFMKTNEIFNIESFEEKTIGIQIPIKVELKVKEAPPTIKGNTAQGGNKQVTLETGLTINAPLFINEGDVLRINTETGEYVERVS